MKSPFSLSSLTDRWQRYKSAEAAAEAASQLTAHAGQVLPFREARGRFGLEITRARRYRDVVTLATVQSAPGPIYRQLRLAEAEAEGDPVPQAGEEVPEEVQRLALALMSPLVRGSVRITDLVAYDANNDDHLILFTETSREEAQRPLERLRERVEARFAMDLQIGVAEFPEDGYTLDDLVERARGERAGPGGHLEAAGGEGGSGP